jgi:hypothetical protein
MHIADNDHNQAHYKCPNTENLTQFRETPVYIDCEEFVSPIFEILILSNYKQVARQLRVLEL